MKSRALVLAGLVALLPALAPVTLAAAVEPIQEFRFSPPAQGLVLSRTVIRELSDGKEIRVTRRYAVRFAPEDKGFRLDGKLIDVAVDVPPVLRQLGEIERRRDDTGMFPVHIDANGAIVDAPAAQAVDRAAHKAMMSRATATLADAGLGRQNMQESSGFIADVLQAQPGSRWPVDLFRVQPGEHRQSRSVPLPGGGEGWIEVVTRVDALLPCGLPRTVERTVTTQLAGSRRVSREVWTFQPARS
ncbi:MAG: hypothetical protein U1E37_05320 [Sphingomonadaceae bacterium]